MKLKKLIEELNNIAKISNNSDSIEVQLADCAPIVKPIFKDGIVYITDEITPSENFVTVASKGKL